MPNWKARGVPLENDPEPEPTRCTLSSVPLTVPNDPDKLPVRPLFAAVPAQFARLKMLKHSAIGSTVSLSLNFHTHDRRRSEVKKLGLLNWPAVGTFSTG